MNPQADEDVQVFNDHPVEGVCWHHGHIDEDILTGYVFSALRYVPRAREEFLRRLCRLNKLPDETLGIGRQVRFEPWPSWEVPADFRETFPKMQAQSTDAPRGQEKGGLEPDLVILGEGWRLLVEAEESKPYDAVQLIQHYVVSRLSNEDDDRRTYQLLVSPTLGRPGDLDKRVRKVWEDHSKSLAQCKDNPDDLVEHLLWIGWEEIEGLLARCALDTADKISCSEVLILLDTCTILRTKGHIHVKSPAQALRECDQWAEEVRLLSDTMQVADRFPKPILDKLVQEKAIVEGLIRFLRSSERFQLEFGPRELSLLQDLLETLRHTTPRGEGR